MALPAGFNPNDMSFGNITKRAPVIEIPRNTSTYSSYASSGYSYHESLWSRFNNGVAAIVITGLIYIIGAWINEGFWIALVMAVVACIGGVIAWYIAALVIVIGVNIIMYGFRLLFWNGWTLLIALALAVGGWLYAANASNGYNYQPQTEVVTPVTRTYRCTAKVLNIRTAPTTSSTVIGTLRKGQQVEVYDTDNGFAQISYNGRTGYVSLKYLDRM